jgi:hypothetical protein
MPRIMYDSLGENSSTLVKLDPLALAIYITGGPGYAWTDADVAQFPHVQTWVRIDQGGPGSPQPEANVMDVEAGAFTVAQIPGWLACCTAPRPTVYCTRSTLPSVPAVAKAIWLAAPGITLAEAIALASTDDRIVAVQYQWPTYGLPSNATYDTSVITDPYWPEKAPVSNHEKAPAPPGLWEKAAVLVGVGLDGNLWTTTYDPANGTWSKPVKAV